MSFRLEGFEVIQRKEMGDSEHELLMMRQEAEDLLVLVLTNTKGKSGAYFGGHNWQHLGRQKSEIGNFFDRIQSVDDFHTLSSTIRDNIQRSLEEDVN